jgi:hypothetical protein
LNKTSGKFEAEQAQIEFSGRKKYTNRPAGDLKRLPAGKAQISCRQKPIKRLFKCRSMI